MESLSLNIIENPMGHGPEQPALDDPALSRENWIEQLPEAASSLNHSM